MTDQPTPPTAPIPVAPLEWPAAPPAPRARRPGIITAMGVVSIVVACLSGMSSFVVTMMAFGFLVGSRAAPAMIPTPPPQVQQAGAPSGPGATAIVGGVQIDPAQSEDGIEESLRPMVIAGMTRVRRLDEGRRKQLDLLLAVAGRSMFPFVSAATTPQTIRANVTEIGRLPSASGGMGPDYFIIGTGRVEVYDTHAIYRPLGSPNVVSVTAPMSEAGSGQPLQPSSQPPSAASPPPPPTTPPVMTPVPNPMASLNPTAATLSIIEGGLSVLLALYLLVIGIMTLRDVGNGAKLHWVYVLLKVPLVILAIVANSWMASSFMSGVNAAATAAAANASAGAPPAAQAAAAGIGTVATIWIILLSFASLLYPVSLVFVLMSRTVRRYYSPIQSDR